MTIRTTLDTLFCGYFFFQIPSTLFLDTQALFPTWIYPQWLKALRSSYLAHYRDPFMAEPSSFPWFMAICSIEFPLEVPFFFLAVYAYYKGAVRCPWIRFPSLLYSVHTATAVLGVLFTVCLKDFSNYSVPGPRDFHDRTRLFFVYFPFMLISVILMFDTLFSSAYMQEKKKTE